MTTLATNRRYFYAVMYFVIACMIAAALTSCSPYAAMSTTVDTPTPAPSVTATAKMIASDSITPTPRPACRVTAYTLNFRSGPGTRHAVKDILHNGERLQILATAADWYKVQTAQRVTGWAYGKYIKCEIGGDDR